MDAGDGNAEPDGNNNQTFFALCRFDTGMARRKLHDQFDAIESSVRVHSVVRIE